MIDLEIRDHQTTAHSAFGIGERVIVDKDLSLVATVTKLCFSHPGLELEVSYFSSGELKRAWVEAWRLSPYDGS